MKAFLFIVAFAFNLFVCFYPFEINSQKVEPSEKLNIAVSPDNKYELPKETAGLAHSELLKTKTCGLQKH